MNTNNKTKTAAQSQNLRDTHNWHLDADGVEVAKGQGEGVAAAPEAPQISEAYDIRNVDFRNLLTVVMGTVSNQTGESFDKAMLRSKSADEILRRFNEVTKQRDELLAACKSLSKLREGWTSAQMNYAIQKAEAAIASVEGKQ